MYCYSSPTSHSMMAWMASNAARVCYTPLSRGGRLWWLKAIGGTVQVTHQIGLSSSQRMCLCLQVRQPFRERLCAFRRRVGCSVAMSSSEEGPPAAVPLGRAHDDCRRGQFPWPAVGCNQAAAFNRCLIGAMKTRAEVGLFGAAML
jgi:hypothetical protein